LKEVLEKGKVETPMDVCALFWGVSGRAKNRLAYREILTLASLGKTAREILNKLEGRK
jgi:hypothetical protein